MRRRLIDSARAGFQRWLKLFAYFAGSVLGVIGYLAIRPAMPCKVFGDCIACFLVTRHTRFSISRLSRSLTVEVVGTEGATPLGLEEFGLHSQGSAFVATLGFDAESRWDSFGLRDVGNDHIGVKQSRNVAWLEE